MWLGNGSGPVDVRKHLAGQHDQRSHGVWSDSVPTDGEQLMLPTFEEADLQGEIGSAISDETFESLIARASQGGFSLNFRGQQPTDGFIVARPGSEMKMTLDELRTEEGKRKFKDYFTTYVKNHLRVPNMAGTHGESVAADRYFGAWMEDGVIYFDLSDRVNTLRQAVTSGVAGKQIAVWDARLGESVYLDGRPGRGFDEMESIRTGRRTTDYSHHLGSRVPLVESPSDRFRVVNRDGKPWLITERNAKYPTSIAWEWGKPKGVKEWVAYLRGERWFRTERSRAIVEGVRERPTTLGTKDGSTVWVTVGARAGQPVPSGPMSDRMTYPRTVGDLFITLSDGRVVPIEELPDSIR